jgi:sarcosine oxidase subunit beta
MYGVSIDDTCPKMAKVLTAMEGDTVSGNTTEVLIIGSGVQGGFTAYHAAKQGRKVLVLERAEPGVEPAASWASAGGVRRQGRHAAEVPLAIEAIARWETLEEELEADLKYRRDGQLRLAESDEAAEAIREFVRIQNENGLTDIRLVDRAEALEIVPGLNDNVVAGSYSPEDGHANPPATTKAAAAAAQRHGAVYRNGVQVVSLIQEGSRVIGVRTADGEEIHAEETVLTAGAWGDEIAASIGIRLPIRTRVLQMLLSTPAEPGLLKPVIGAIGRQLSLKQLPGGEFFLGGGWLGDATPDRRGYTLRQSSEDGNWAAATGLLPAVGEQKIARKWGGLEGISYDEIPFIGRAPGIDGLTIAAGFTGHGFAISPAVGRAIADLIAGKPVPELDGLKLERISTFDPEDVERFINEPAAEQTAPAG